MMSYSGSTHYLPDLWLNTFSLVDSVGGWEPKAGFFHGIGGWLPQVAISKESLAAFVRCMAVNEPLIWSWFV